MVSIFLRLYFTFRSSRPIRFMKWERYGGPSYQRSVYLDSTGGLVVSVDLLIESFSKSFVHYLRISWYRLSSRPFSMGTLDIIYFIYNLSVSRTVCRRPPDFHFITESSILSYNLKVISLMKLILVFSKTFVCTRLFFFPLFLRGYDNPIRYFIVKYYFIVKRLICGNYVVERVTSFCSCPYVNEESLRF